MSNAIRGKKLPAHKAKKQIRSNVEEVASPIDHEALVDGEKTDIVNVDISEIPDDKGIEEAAQADEQQEKVAEDEETLSVLDEATEEKLEDVPEHFMNSVEQKTYITSTRAIRQNSSVKGASIAIVNHKNSQRCHFSKPVANKLDFQAGDYLQIYVENDGVYVLKSTDASGIPVAKGNCIYSKKLVNLITKMFGLDFETVSTQHLMSVEYKRYHNQIVAVIK